MKQIFDMKGKEIKEFDLLKTFHFTAAVRREKHYLYHWVKIKNGELVAFFLDGSDESRPLWASASDYPYTMKETEIINR